MNNLIIVVIVLRTTPKSKILFLKNFGWVVQLTLFLVDLQKDFFSSAGFRDMSFQSYHISFGHAPFSVFSAGVGSEFSMSYVASGFIILDFCMRSARVSLQQSFQSSPYVSSSTRFTTSIHEFRRHSFSNASRMDSCEASFTQYASLYAIAACVYVITYTQLQHSTMS